MWIEHGPQSLLGYDWNPEAGRALNFYLHLSLNLATYGACV